MLFNIRNVNPSIYKTKRQDFTFCLAALVSKIDPRGCAADAGKRQLGGADVTGFQQTLKHTQTIVILFMKTSGITHSYIITCLFQYIV